MEVKLIKNYFLPRKVLDIGANIGQFRTLFQKEYPHSLIFSVEASEGCEIYLKKLTNDYMIVLLGKDNETHNFYSRQDTDIGTGDSIYKEKTGFYADKNLKIIKKQSKRLDDIFSNEFDLIKIDTQGSEIDIIKGGPILCSKSKGIILEVSMNEYNIGSPLYEEVVDFMKSIGFLEKETLREIKNHIANQKDILFLNESVYNNI